MKRHPRQLPRLTRDQEQRLERIQDRLLALPPYRELRDLAPNAVLPKLMDRAVVELGVSAAEKLAMAGTAPDMPRAKEGSKES